MNWETLRGWKRQPELSLVGLDLVGGPLTSPLRGWSAGTRPSGRFGP